MTKLSDLLSRLGLAPKNLPEAQAAITPAKQTLDSVAALFTAAGLDLDALLATGPDALKAHLDSLAIADGALAEAQARVIALETDAAAQAATLAAAQAEVTTLKAAQVTAEEQARRLLAASGHAAPLSETPGQDATQPIAKTDAAIAAEYLAMADGPARLKFFEAHHDALFRASKSAKR